MSTRYVLSVQYDGTDYCGWQRQKNGLSVQEVLEKALTSALGITATVTGSGRTDAGVHAVAQVCHFDAEGLTLPPEKIREAVNPFLPPAVKILSSCKGEEGFHARFSAKQKTYEYTYLLSETDQPLFSRYAAHIRGEVNLEKMRAAAKTIEGTHDFCAFSSTGSEVKDTVRTVFSVCVEFLPFDSGKEGLIKIAVTGNGFLYNMVRIIAGTLLEIGQGKREESAFSLAIATGKRNLLGKTAPARGLTLKRVEYLEKSEK